MRDRPALQSKIPQSVSVVVPFGKDPEKLRDQIAALIEGSSAEISAQIIVSCNRKALMADALAVVSSAPGGIPAMVIDSSSKPGPSGARNAGWQASTSEYVLFCDSDDVAAPGWIEAMTASLSDADLAIGSLDIRNIGNRADICAWWAPENIDLYPKFHHLPYGPAASLGVRRSMLERVGGFDDAARAAEDIDLCWRIQYAGGVVARVSASTVHYRLRDSTRALCSQGFAWGQWDAWLLKRHRKYGARRNVKDTFWELRALALTLMRAVTVHHERSHALFWLATIAGRAVGSARYGTWTI
jgi:GT2 family glycosyltransferase